MTTNNELSHHSMRDLSPPIMQRVVAQGTQHKLEIDGDRVRNGLAQLVLTLIKLLHELLERQAIRRMDSGSLSDEEIEQLGTTLMHQAEELDKLRELFGLKDEDLNFNLGPLGRLL
jgi:actin-like ATPase involved in cell morphogenesis